jgi:hypothetical protein
MYRKISEKQSNYSKSNLHLFNSPKKQIKSDDFAKTSEYFEREKNTASEGFCEKLVLTF